ncbi:MAG: nitrate reductase molybdenum cofactor assembly chaperone [Alphaproteobacteria bacterium]|nr:nitrate reductase molybdenum cofactor assembly chaperone [Alphaproteobacteria bacterium]
MIVLRALGILLTYPRPELRAALPEIADALRASPLIAPQDRDALEGLIVLLTDADQLWAEENYVELFDRGRATSLHLFEHVHGDTRARGDAMVDLKSVYERAGFSLAANELPDFLPVVLEYLSCRDLAETKDMIGDCAHVLRAVGETLLQRGSIYSAVFAALLGIAGQPGLDRKAASRRAAETEDLDREWTEQPAFGPQTPAGGSSGIGRT